MTTRKVTYKEPASYFNADMRKAAREYDKKAKQTKTAEKAKKNKK